MGMASHTPSIPMMRGSTSRLVIIRPKVRTKEMMADIRPSVSYTHLDVYKRQVLGMITGIASTAIGLLFAYVEVYVKLKTKVLEKLFAMVSMLPVEMCIRDRYIRGRAYRGAPFWRVRKNHGSHAFSQYFQT